MGMREWGLAIFCSISVILLIVATDSRVWASYNICTGSTSCVGFNYGMFKLCVVSQYATACTGVSLGYGAYSGTGASTDAGFLQGCQFFAIVAILLTVMVNILMYFQAARVKIPWPIPEQRVVNIAAGALGVSTLFIVACIGLFAGKGFDTEWMGFPGMQVDVGWGFVLMIISAVFFLGITFAYLIFFKELVVSQPAPAAKPQQPQQTNTATADTAA